MTKKEQKKEEGKKKRKKMWVAFGGKERREKESCRDRARNRERTKSLRQLKQKKQEHDGQQFFLLRWAEEKRERKQNWEGDVLSQ